jgi:hypothetical protein
LADRAFTQRRRTRLNPSNLYAKLNPALRCTTFCLLFRTSHRPECYYF